MLTFPKILGRSLVISLSAIAADGLVSYAMTLLGFSFIETMGDLMLIEVAVLFLVAGVIDFSSSVGGVHLRRAVLGSRQEYSPSTHRDKGRKALVLVVAGTIMFLILIFVGIVILSGS
jgi:uncharacterized membrane protein YidH (DUF202 family)